MLVCRQWYDLCYPHFLSRLMPDLYLSSNRLERFPEPSTEIFKVLSQNVRRLSIRLLGHPSNKVSLEPWFHNPDHKCQRIPIHQRYDADYRITNLHWDSKAPPSCKALYLYNGQISPLSRVLVDWKKNINNALKKLAPLLYWFSNLEELAFIASSDFDDSDPWERTGYLFHDTVERLIYYLPPALHNLTFDTNDTDFAASGRRGEHLCPTLRPRIYSLHRVRLRMRAICPSVFPMPTTWSCDPPKLETLSVRLYPSYNCYSWDACMSNFHGLTTI